MQIQASEWLNTDHPVQIQAAKGELIVVAFIEPNCCDFKTETATLTKMWTQYQERGLRVVGVTLQGPGIISAFSQQDVRWPVAIDQGDSTHQRFLNRKWHSFTSGLSTFLVIGRTGTPIALFRDVMQLRWFIEDLFKNESPSPNTHSSLGATDEGSPHLISF